jgi:hypothetical protein
MLLKRDKGGYPTHREYLSASESKMYETALKQGKKDVVNYFENKIEESLKNKKAQQLQELEMLSDKQGDDMVKRQRLYKQTSQSPYAATTRQAQSILQPRQSNTSQTLGNYQTINTPDKVERAMDARKVTDGVTDMMPVVGDIKDINNLWSEYKQSGKVNPLLLASILPFVGTVGDAAKVFKPVIKDYNSATEMFTDFLKQAKEQGFEVDRNSKLYKQIQEELPGAKEFYKDLSNKDEQIADALYLSTKSEQAQKGLKDSKIQDLVYHGTTSKPFTEIDESKIGSNMNNSGYYGSGLYTTNNRRIAEYYGGMKDKVMPLLHGFNKVKIYEDVLDKSIPSLSLNKTQKRKLINDFLMEELPEDVNKAIISAETPYLRQNISQKEAERIISEYFGEPVKFELNNRGNFEEDLYKQTAKDLKLRGKDGIIGKKDTAFGKNADPDDREYVTLNPTKTKSLFREHLGKWDWDNPNIHKAVGAGTALGLGLNRGQEKQNGGKIKRLYKKGGKICKAGKDWVDKKPGGWSAYKAMQASKFCKDPNYAKSDKKENGGILFKKGGKAGTQLKAWRDEKWTKSDGSLCGNDKAQSNPSRCKPAAKWKTMSESEKKADNAKKKKEGSKGKQFVSATEKGKVTKTYTKR